MSNAHASYLELYPFVTRLAIGTRCDRRVVISTLALMARIASSTRKGLNVRNVKRYWLAAFQLTHDLATDRPFSVAGWAKLAGEEYGEKPIAFLQFSLLKILHWDYAVDKEEHLAMSQRLVDIYEQNLSIFAKQTAQREESEPPVADPVVCATPGATPPDSYQGASQVW